MSAGRRVNHVAINGGVDGVGKILYEMVVLNFNSNQRTHVISYFIINFILIINQFFKVAQVKQTKSSTKFCDVTVVLVMLCIVNQLA